VISRSGVVISITNCYIRFTLLLLYFSLQLHYDTYPAGQTPPSPVQLAFSRIYART